MNHELLRHDVATACAENSFHFLTDLAFWNEEEVYAGLYRRVLAALEFYELQTSNMQRLTPGRN